MLCVTNERLKRRSENVLRAPQDRLKKQGTQAVATSHNITINNKLNLHYLLYLFQLRRKKIKFSAKCFSLLANTAQGRVDKLN